MHMAAVKSLLSSLHQLSNQFISNTSSGLGQASIQQSGNIKFSIEKTISIVVNNLHSKQFGSITSVTLLSLNYLIISYASVCLYSNIWMTHKENNKKTL